MVTTEKLITPILAEKLLKTNTSNRKVTQSHVDFLAKQMKEGNYIEETGESIKFSKTNRLLDGQHRLLALIKSGRSYKFRVDEELDDKIFNVIDTGRSRSSGDILSIQGYKNAHLLAATVRFILEYENKRVDFTRSIKYSNEEIIQFVDKNPDIASILTVSDAYYRSFRTNSPSIIAGIYFILLKKGHSEQTINNFFDQYSTGLGISQNSPVYHLRDRFIKNSINKSKLRISDKVSLIITAWNSYIKGRTLTSLKIPSEFPKII